VFKKLFRRVKNSYFMVNKLYLWILFFILLAFNAAVAFVGAAVVFVLFLFTRRVPLEPKEHFRFDTYVYKRMGNSNLKMDIWYPNEEKVRYPTVFFAHGGGWISGFRNMPNNISWSKYLASKGFAVVSVDYRYGYNNGMEEILHDYTDALAYIRENGKMLKLNTNKMALMGLSAGGHLALLYAAYYTYKTSVDIDVPAVKKLEGIQGVVAFYAPSDLKDVFEKDNKSLFARFATRTTMKGMPDEIGDIYDYYSPVKWVSRDMLPTFIAHGREDTVVPVESSVKLAGKLKECGVKYKFFVHKRGDHGFEFKLKDFQTVRILEDTVKYLKGLLKA